MSVNTTTNLEQFTFHTLNRHVNRAHVKKLAKSILKIGQKVPITVTTNNVIIDGQHRYEAIKMLIESGEKVRISFIRKNMKIGDIAEINAHQLQWRNADWIDYHAATGNENYKQLIAIAEEYKPLKVSALAPFIHDDDEAFLITNHLTSGQLKVKLTEEKRYILEQLVSLNQFNSAFSQKAVLVAIMWLRRDENFNAKRLFDKLNANLHSIRLQSGTGNWARHFTWWYNHGLRKGKLNENDLPRHH